MKKSLILIIMLLVLVHTALADESDVLDAVDEAIAAAEDEDSSEQDVEDSVSDALTETDSSRDTSRGDAARAAIASRASSASNRDAATRDARGVLGDVNDALSEKDGVEADIADSVSDAISDQDMPTRRVLRNNVIITEDGQTRTLRNGNIAARSSLILEADEADEDGTITARLSNGKSTVIKVMPEVASETAIKRLRLNTCNQEDGCTIELRETGTGETNTAAYFVSAKRNARILGIFPAKLSVTAQVDAETGEVVVVHKPWWSFLAFG